MSQGLEAGGVGLILLRMSAAGCLWRVSICGGAYP